MMQRGENKNPNRFETNAVLVCWREEKHRRCSYILHVIIMISFVLMWSALQHDFFFSSFGMRTANLSFVAYLMWALDSGQATKQR